MPIHSGSRMRKNEQRCKSEWRSSGRRWKKDSGAASPRAESPDVRVAPVRGDAEAFSRKIDFGKITAVHNDQRLIYVDSTK
jgi:hypothetical protein